MGFSEKSQMDGCVDSEGKKWVIAGIPLRTPLKPILITKPVVVDKERDDKDDEECSTTPTAVEARIPARLPCPPAPKKKRKPSSRCHYSGVREFFTPPDLETVFIRHVERA